MDSGHFTTGLANARCFNHTNREAAVRCPACGRMYCRECVSEHEGCFLCAPCLSAAATRESRPRRSPRALGVVLRLAVALALAWAMCYVAGKALLAVPADFHDAMVEERS